MFTLLAPFILSECEGRNEESLEGSCPPERAKASGLSRARHRKQ
jgi:hypothetical protein